MFSQGYLIDTQLCIAALWLFYIALLHRRINLTAARLYLLFLFPVGMLLPLLRIPLLPAIETSVESLQIIEIEALPTTIPIVEPVPEWSLVQVLWWFYLAGVAATTIVTGVGIVRTWLRTRRVKGRVVFSPKVAGAYSVFGTIFVNDKYEGSPLLGQILAHEQSHLDLHHSRDLVGMNLWRIMLWFNPLSWHAFKLLREVHEFQADRSVIRQGNPVGPYIELLIGTEAGIYPGTANALCYSLTKKRLKMIAQTTRGTRLGGALRLAALPVFVGGLLGAFSLTAQAADTTEPAPAQPQPALAAPADTLKTTTVKVERKLDTLDLDIQPITKVYVDGHRLDTLNRIDLDVQPLVVRVSEKTNSVTTSLHQPIYVIDGIIYDADPFTKKQIDAKDYLSVTVLKGAAATAEYGDRGKNGAIVITTTKGQQGKYQAQTVRLSEIKRNFFTGKYTPDSTAGKQTPPDKSVLIIQDGWDGPTKSKLIIYNGEIIMDQGSGRSGNPTGEIITITRSKREIKRGVSIGSKLLKEYPDLFYKTDDGGVTNRKPVSIRVQDEK